MSSERNIDMFSALILVISSIGLILFLAFDFGYLHIGGGNYRFSCLFCDLVPAGYTTVLGFTAQLFVLILLIVQIIIALNDLLPKRFIEKDLDKIGLLLAVLTVIWVIVGLASFGVTYDPLYDWYMDTGFYGSIIAGIINTILFFLKFRNK